MTSSRFAKPTNISQQDMTVAYQQLMALKELQTRQEQQQMKATQICQQAMQGSQQRQAMFPQAWMTVQKWNSTLEPAQDTSGFSTNVGDFLYQSELVPKVPKVYKRYNRDKKPLYVDPTLPPGWNRSVKLSSLDALHLVMPVHVSVQSLCVYQEGKPADDGGLGRRVGHVPDRPRRQEVRQGAGGLGHRRRRFRSRQEIKRHFERIGETFLRWEDFDFNPFGSKGQVISITTNNVKISFSGC